MSSTIDMTFKISLDSQKSLVIIGIGEIPLYGSCQLIILIQIYIKKQWPED